MLEAAHRQHTDVRLDSGGQRCEESAFRIVATQEPLSAYAIAQLALATGCCYTDVVQNVELGAWTCPRFGVLCSHVASAA